MFGCVQDSSLAPFQRLADGCPPRFNGVWIGCDEAFDSKDGSAAIGVIIYDANGSILLGCGKKVSASSAIMSEALATREACYLARDIESRPPFIFLDSKQLVDLCCSSKVPPWEISAMVFCSLSYVSRSFSGTAQVVAKLARKDNLSRDWVSCPPLEISSALFCDFRPPWFFFILLQPFGLFNFYFYFFLKKRPYIWRQ